MDNGEPGIAVKALYDYEAAEPDELTFKTGKRQIYDLMEQLKKDLSDIFSYRFVYIYYLSITSNETCFEHS